jgi:HPt (histidine-containing phosphotransfer) domain-containing protein
VLKGAADTVGAIGFAQLCRNVQQSAERAEVEAACADALALIADTDRLLQVLQSATSENAGSWRQDL